MANGFLSALSIGGTYFSMKGTLDAASDKASIMREKAELKELAAQETLYRNNLNNAFIKRKAREDVSTQQAQIAGSGAQVGAESSLDIIEKTTKDAIEQTLLNTKVAEFEAYMRRREAASLREGASKIKKSARLTALGQMLGGTAGLYKAST
jgi:hypothetical protein